MIALKHEGRLSRDGADPLGVLLSRVTSGALQRLGPLHLGENDAIMYLDMLMLERPR